MPKYTVNNHSILNVQSEEAKSGASWHDIARGRAFKQHGDAEDLPEGDIHAVRKHQDPHLHQRNPDEENQALDSLEGKIKQLQQSEQQKAQTRTYPQQQPQQDQTQLTGEQYDTYDDWFKD
jgi:hypothetical protein